MSPHQAYAAPSQPKVAWAQMGWVRARRTVRSDTFATVMTVRCAGSIKGTYATITTNWTPGQSVVGLRETEYQQQKQAFSAITPSTLEPLNGKWVVSRNGAIEDSDIDLNTLTSRFFRKAGDIAVYITRIGGEPEDYIVSPVEED